MRADVAVTTGLIAASKPYHNKHSHMAYTYTNNNRVNHSSLTLVPLYPPVGERERERERKRCIKKAHTRDYICIGRTYYLVRVGNP